MYYNIDDQNMGAHSPPHTLLSIGQKRCHHYAGHVRVHNFNLLNLHWADKAMLITRGCLTRFVTLHFYTRPYKIFSSFNQVSPLSQVLPSVPQPEQLPALYLLCHDLPFY